MAMEWLIEARDGGGTVVRFVHSGLLGDNWEAEYNGLSVGDRAYLTKLAVYLKHFAPRTAKHSLFLPGPVTQDSWAAMTAAVGVGADAADGQPARLSVPGIEPADGTVEFVSAPSFVGMRTADAMYMLIHGYNDMAFATAHYFDDRDPAAETQAWQNWLGGLAAQLGNTDRLRSARGRYEPGREVGSQRGRAVQPARQPQAGRAADAQGLRRQRRQAGHRPRPARAGGRDRAHRRALRPRPRHAPGRVPAGVRQRAAAAGRVGTRRRLRRRQQG
jgi:hypothetical protein